MGLRTSRADANFFSISNGIYQWYAGTPDARAAAVLPYPLVFGPDSKTYRWASYLKICDGTNGLRLGGVVITQGDENTADFNNEVSDTSLSGEFGFGGGRGQQVFTLKGGCRNIRLWGIIYSKGDNADVVIDAWSDQSDKLCGGTDLSGLIRADGQPITIILGRFGSKVDAYPASYRVLFWKSLGYRFYWLGKWAAVKLGLIKGVQS